jgi:type IV pilus assembly protein PilW
MPNTSADLMVQTNLNPPPFVAAGGDIVLISDCGGAAIFQITQYTVASGSIVHNTGGSLTPGNATKDLGRRFDVGAELLKLSTVSYFIRNSDNGTGPALWRRVGSTAAEELVEGVENMQVQYGEDTDADAVPDIYRTANNVSNWRNVTTARIALLAVGQGEGQAGETDTRTFTLLDRNVGPFNDKRLRRVVTMTISLRNKLP